MPFKWRLMIPGAALKKINKGVPFSIRSQALTPAAVLLESTVGLALSTGSFSYLEYCLGVSHLSYCSTLLLQGCWTPAEKVLPIKPGWSKSILSLNPYETTAGGLDRRGRLARYEASPASLAESERKVF